MGVFTDRQQGDSISLLLFFKNKESRLKTDKRLRLKYFCFMFGRVRARISVRRLGIRNKLLHTSSQYLQTTGIVTKIRS
jgi:hypothetical protein